MVSEIRSTVVLMLKMESESESIAMALTLRAGGGIERSCVEVAGEDAKMALRLLKTSV